MKRWTAALLFALFMMSAISVSGQATDPTSFVTRGVQDSYIAGRVLNATAGLVVKVSATDLSVPPPGLWVNFTGVTDPQGRFNITVDSDPNNYTAYSVSIEETYYKIPTRWLHIFERPMNESSTQNVPLGSLEYTDAPLGDLTITILNGSSMEPLSGVAVNIDIVGPDPPFPTGKVTGAQGTVQYLGIRATNTTVTASRVNFLNLQQSTDIDYTWVMEGVQNNAAFVLRERPWPFSTIPADGATDVNHTNSITIDFGTEMDQSSITDVSAYTLSPVGGEPVGLSVEAFSANTKARIIPASPLDFNRTYDLRIDNTVKTKVGARLLWRAMTVSFTTERPPARVTGRLLETGTELPIEGVEVTLKDLSSMTGPDGRFHFPVVVPGEYTLKVEDSYFYFGLTVGTIGLVKGDVKDMSDIHVEPRPNGSLEVKVTSGGMPLQGAWVAVQGSALNLTTDADGSAVFPRTRTGLVTLRSGAPHHDMVLDQAQVEEGERSFIVLSLMEDPMPVTVEATDTLPGDKVAIDSHFIARMPGPIEFSTLSVGIWTLDGEGERASEVAILPITAGGEADTYLIKPSADLAMERRFVLVIDEGLRLDGSSDPLIWRDLTFEFATPDLPMSSIAGGILMEGLSFEGLEVSFSGSSGSTNATGGFNITLDLSDPTLIGTLVFDGAPWGYSSISMEYEISAGVHIWTGIADLSPLPGRYSVTPGDGETGVEPDVDIVFTFSDPIETPQAGLSSVLSVVKEGDMTMVPGDLKLSGDNRTVTLDTRYDLEQGSSYRVRVSPDLLLRTGYPACPVGNVTVFTVKAPFLRVLGISPEQEVLDDMPLDQRLTISFSGPVERTLLEGSLAVTPTPSMTVFDWRSSSEVAISMFLITGIDYTLTVPAIALGPEGQVLEAALTVLFTAGDDYVMEHTESSFFVYPEPSQKVLPGTLVNISGVVSNSEGYLVRAVMTGGVGDVTAETTVSQDGSYTLSLRLPDKEGEYGLTITIGVPGSPPAITKTFELDVEGEDAGGENEPDMTVPIVIAVVLVLVIIIVLAAVFMTMQRRKAQREMDEREYDEVDMDLEE